MRIFNGNLNSNAAPFELTGGGRFALSRKEFVPAYVAAFEQGVLQERSEQAIKALRSCRVCPRDCEIDRFNNKIGVCKSGRLARVASAFPHFGEEDCLRGWNGSGTIFFSFCNLRCVFCQNWELSQVGKGRELRTEELAESMLALQARGCHNINFVTPEHVVPQLLEALLLAADAGLTLPLVYNTSAYDSLRSLELLDGVVDVYMPDFKYWDGARARRYLKAEDYPDVARRVIREMHRQVGPLRFDRDGLAVRGLLVRHLVMPGALDDAREIFRFLATEVSADTYVDVMDQYHPAGAVDGDKYPELCRRPDASERLGARQVAEREGLWRVDTRWRRRGWDRASG